MYAEGQGVKQNFTQSMMWYNLAANQGTPARELIIEQAIADTPFNIGVLYATGHGGRRGTTPRPWIGIAWPHRRGTSARRGQARRHVLHRPGRGAGRRPGRGLVSQGRRAGAGRRAVRPRRHVRQRPGRGAGLCPGRDWYRKAAEQGQADAQHNLGVMYAGGLGVAQEDYVQAHMWLSLAEAQGNEASAVDRDILETRMTTARRFRGGADGAAMAVRATIGRPTLIRVRTAVGKRIGQRST